MIIASQHSWKDPDYVPKCAWGENTLVQWGRKGVVFRSGKPPYTTAFFEAFPADHDKSGSFIRGEGETIEDAERDAFRRHSKRAACNHLWGRRHYLNGGQLCRHCNAFRSGVVKPIVTLGNWRKPLDGCERHLLDDFNEKLDGASPYMRKLKLRAKFFGTCEAVLER